MVLRSDISLTFAQPLSIPVGKARKLPEAIDDSRLSDVVGKWNAQPKDTPSLLEYHVHNITLFDILGQVLETQDPGTEASSDPGFTARVILNLDERIMDWHNNLPPYLKCESHTPAVDPLLDLTPPEPVSDSQVVLDFPALAKRLRCRQCIHLLVRRRTSDHVLRFLHSRQLLLRPALEMLFKKQQRIKSHGSRHDSAKTKLSDSVLRDMAAQCVLAAVELVEFLAFQIQTQTFVCWWYNITCKSLTHIYLREEGDGEKAPF